MSRLQIAITGPDNTGKQRIADFIAKNYDVEVIEATSFRHSGSPLIRTAGRFSRSITELADRIESKPIAAAGYFLDLALFNIARYAARKPIVYVRYPPIDFEVYAREYTACLGPFAGAAEVLLKPFAGRFGLDSLVYLYANPKTIMQRQNGTIPQLHEKSGSIERIVTGYNYSIFRVDIKKTNLKFVDTTKYNPDEVEKQVDDILLDIFIAAENRKITFRERIQNFIASRKPFDEDKMKAIADDLFQRKIIDSDYNSIEQRLDGTSYIAKHLGAHIAIGVSTVPIIFPGLTDMVSSIAKESWSTSWMLYEGLRGNFSKSLVHLTVMPVCWMPRVGGLSYLVPLAAKDPEAALVYMYAVSKAITRKNPEELCELVGGLKPVKLVIKGYDAGAHHLSDALGAGLKYFFTPHGQFRQKISQPINEWLLENSQLYSAVDYKFQNIKHMAHVLSNEIIGPSLSRGARG